MLEEFNPVPLVTVEGNTVSLESEASDATLSENHERGSVLTVSEISDKQTEFTTSSSSTLNEVSMLPVENPDVKMVEIATIKTLEKFQTRTGLNQRLLEKYVLIPAENFPPILIARSDNQSLDGLVLGGAHRIEAAKKRGDTHIRARFVEIKDETQALIEAFKDNLHGKNLTRDELKKLCRLLHDTHGITMEEIGKIVGRNKSSVSRILSEQKAPAAHKAINMKAVQKNVISLIGKLEARLSEVNESDPDRQNLSEAVQALKKIQSTGKHLSIIQTSSGEVSPPEITE